jgi:hypothetical protein
MQRTERKPKMTEPVTIAVTEQGIQDALRLLTRADKSADAAEKIKRRLAERPGDPDMRILRKRGFLEPGMVAWREEDLQ